MPQQPWELVRGTEADLPAYRALTEAQYGPDALASPAYWQWFMWANPVGPAPFWLAKAEGRIVGGTVGQPVRAKVGEREVLVHILSNILVGREFRQQGILSALIPWLIQDSAKLGAAFCFGVAGPQVERAWRKQDMAAIGPANPLMLKPLDVGALLAYKGVRSRPLHWLANAGYKVASPFLRGRWLNAPAAGLTLAEVSAFDERFDHFWQKIERKYDTLWVRKADFLQWRYKDVPLKAARCLAATDGQGEIVAYIIFRSARLEGIATGLILDFLIEASERGRQAGNELVAEVTAEFERDGLALGTCVMLPHTDEIKVLRQQGYIPCPRSLEPHPLTMMYKSSTHEADWGNTLLRDCWFYTLGDWGIDAFSA